MASPWMSRPLSPAFAEDHVAPPSVVLQHAGLVCAFGDAYRTYRARVPMLAPRLGRALELERATASFSIRS